MLSLSGPKALLCLQLLIDLINRSAVNVYAISNGFLLVSLITIRVLLEEVCICLDELPLKVITSLSASRFVLLSIPLIVLHRLVRSVFWSMVSRKSPFFPFVHTHAVL